MKEVAKITASFTPSGFFAFRTPLLPLAKWLDWGAGMRAATAEEAEFAAAYADDVAQTRVRLAEIVAPREIQDALFLASPSLFEHFPVWQENPAGERGRKVEQALTRYFSRMAARPTPFGLFAGCSLGKISDNGAPAQLTVAGRATYQRHTRLDMDFLFALVNELRRDESLQHELTFRPNSSLYRMAGRIRYIEARVKDKKRTYHLVAVEETPYLTATLERAGDGAKLAALAAPLISAEITGDDACAYLRELVGSQILVPDLPLYVTGAEAIHPLIECLRQFAPTQEIGETLAQVRDELAALDQAGLGAQPARYRAINEKLAALPATIEPARLFQVDMVKPAPEAVLGAAVVKEMLRGMEVLHRLSGAADDGLSDFCQKFSTRYEEREVPLVEALDEENGVGFGTGREAAPLLQGVGLGTAAQPNLTVGAGHNFLLRKLHQAWLAGAQEIALTDDDIEKLARQKNAPLPDAWELMGTLTAASPQALAEGDFRLYWGGASGPSGARLLGRFAHADEELQEALARHLRAEEAHAPEAIWAEIVHLPEGRIGNVIARPVLRAYEISFLGDSGAARDKQIPVNDLLVSVREGKVRLRSARLGREVIPRLSNAHNFGWGSLGVYRFLGMLQTQGLAGGIGWSWQGLGSAPFLPRVTYGKLIFSLARWNATKDELKQLGAATEPDARFQAVQKWRAERRLPRYLSLTDGDNILPLDLDNPLCVESFVSLVHKREGAQLSEIFPAPGELCASGPEGLFTHELVVPFVKTERESEGAGGREKAPLAHAERFSPTPPLPHSPTPRKRHFTPGSEWLFAKIYTGTATADAVLREVLAELKEKAVSSGAAREWFFLRYADPDPHLRVRFCGEPERLQREVGPELHRALEPLLDSGAVWRVQWDTYQREIERYGGPASIELCERIFCADSDAALEIVRMLEPGDAGLDERWRLACAGMDLLLEDFGLDLAEKHELLHRVREGFFQEFGGEQGLAVQLGNKYRAERKSLGDLLAYDGAHPLAPGVDELCRRSERVRPLARQLRELEQNKQLNRPLSDIILSFLHLHANRLLRSAQRPQELVIYDLLARHYNSLLVRNRQPTSRLPMTKAA